MKEEMESNGTLIKVLIGIVIILVIVLVVIIVNSKKETKEGNEVKSKEMVNSLSMVNGDSTEKNNSNNTDKEESKDISNEVVILPTMLDDVEDNSSWCGTFQLIWNDMCDEVVDGDVIFKDSDTPDMVKNLNEQQFKEEDISEEYYYKIWGLKTTELKDKIEKGIKEKFNEKSDVIDKINWKELNDENNSEVKRYIFYAMLKRDFKFEKEFTILDNDKFDNQYEDIKYFGIDETTDKKVREQVDVLYYNSDDDFAVIITASDDDQVVLVRNPEGKNFKEIYDNMKKKSKAYNGDKTFGTRDTLKVPNIKMDLLKEYNELVDRDFETKDGIGNIQSAMQTIQMELDNKGGSIKSEAAMDMMTFSAIDIEKEARNFNYDGPYTMFLKEASKDKPYFAANITNITLYQ